MSESTTKPLVTVETILDYLANAIESKTPVAPTVWIEAASKLNVLLGDEHNLLCEMEQQVSILKLGFLAMDEKRNVSAATARVKSMEEFKNLRKQELLCKRVEEFVRLAKLRSRLLAEEMRGN
jgi:hypothetical protein